MSENIHIFVPAGKSFLLETAGKICNSNIIVTAGGNSEPDIDTISIPFSSLTINKKLMPDGSLAEEVNTYASVHFIDVSMLSDNFILRYPAVVDCTIRIAQYDSNNVSLSSSFALAHSSETTEDYDVWHVTKLDGCKYIRIFLSGSGPMGLDGELKSVES